VNRSHLDLAVFLAASFHGGMGKMRRGLMKNFALHSVEVDDSVAGHVGQRSDRAWMAVHDSVRDDVLVFPIQRWP
jgi:hypothetical protein